MAASKKPRTKKAPEATVEPAPSVIAWKGFDKNLRCRGHQFKVGETYTHKGAVVACGSGFHACENPLDVWSYYGLEDGNRFCRVHLTGALDRHEGDSKIAAETITVETEVTLGEMIRAGVEYTVNATKGQGDDPGGDNAQIGASGNYAQIGASGNYARIGASGYNARIGASGNYAQIGASGDNAQIGASGNYARIDVSGQHSIAASVGVGGCIKAPAGTPIAIAEFDANYRPIRFVTGIVGQDGIKPDTFYRAENGKLVEA